MNIKGVVAIGKRAISMSQVYVNSDGDLNSNNNYLDNTNDSGRMTQALLGFNNENLQKDLYRNL